MAGIPREIQGNGDRCCGNTAGMEMAAVRIRRVWNLFFFAGTPRECFRKLADDKNSGASVRIMGKLRGEMSYVATKYVVDS